MSDVILSDGRKDEYVEDSGTLSPSQIDTFKDCARKWAFTYVEGIRPPPQGSAALGAAIHAQLEKYLKGQPFDFTTPGHPGDIAAGGLPLLPMPGKHLEVEKSFKFRSKTGIWYRGFVDLCVPPEHRAEAVPLIHDHKSTSSISRWAKTPEILRTDSQAIIYGKSALLRWPDSPAVDLQWMYLQTKRPYVSKLVTLQLSREHVEQEFDKIEVDGAKILTTLKNTKRALDLAPTVSACRQYGGCPFQSQCNLSPSQFLAATMTEAKAKPPTEMPIMGFLSSLTSGKIESVAASASQPDPNYLSPYAPGCEPPPGNAATSPFFANLPPAALQVPPMPKSDQPINPPEFQTPPPSGQAAVDAANASIAAEQVPGGRKRGRPPGSKNKATAAERTESLPLVVTADVSALTAPPAAVGVPSSADSQLTQLAGTLTARVPFTLYVDCIPISAGSYTHAETYFAQAVQQIQKEFPGAIGWRVGHEELGFGRGAELLSALVAEIAKERNQNVVLDTRTPEGVACKAALVALTPNVVMGF